MIGRDDSSDRLESVWQQPHSPPYPVLSGVPEPVVGIRLPVVLIEAMVPGPLAAKLYKCKIRVMMAQPPTMAISPITCLFDSAWTVSGCTEGVILIHTNSYSFTKGYAPILSLYRFTNGFRCPCY